MSWNQHLFALLVLCFNIAAAFATGEGMDLDCDPCIERPDYRIKVIVHGISSDKFWQRVRTSSMQAALDMRVKLDFNLYDTFNPEVMAEDIVASATGLNPPDALIVTIPSSIVASAVQRATEHVPVFGMNSGYDIAAAVGVLDYIAMDEYQGGVLAAKEFQKESANITKALYLNHGPENDALTDRRDGFQNELGADVVVDELFVDITLPLDDNVEMISSELEGCEYDVVLLAGSEATLDMAMEVFEGCFGSGMYLGAFDENLQAYEAIATGRLLFTISQQSHLQGTLSVVAAATYATTEKKLSSSQAAFGTYLSGPIAISFDNLPSDTVQSCEEDAFPVCPNTFQLDGITNSTCPCLDRSKIKIAGVLHGITTDGFWDVVFAQAAQAADDLGVELKIDRLEPQPTSEILHSKMANQIISLCKEGVDGIFISFPSELLFEAVKQCQKLNVPVISVNSGAEFAAERNLIHHIAQLEYDAGFEAGKRMAQEGAHTGVCLPYEPDNKALIERCDGFENGMKSASSNITYLGNPTVPFDSKLVYIDEVERIVGVEGDWDGIAALSIGPATVGALLSVKEKHSKLVVGTFDTNGEVFDELAKGNLLFGIDQNPFMQGYMPVWLLTIMAHTKQNLQNPYIKTGPRFVEEAPSNALQICTANHFEVCPRPVETDENQLQQVRPVGLTMAGISMSISIILMVWIWYYRETAVVRKSQPLFLGMICIGTFLMAATIIPLSIDDSIASVEGCTIACMSSPWLFWIGFIFAFSALSSKIERIKKLVDSARSFRRVTVTVWDVMTPFLFLLTLTLILLLVWTIVDPMFWVRKNVFGSVDGRSTFGYCAIGKTGVSTAMVVCLTVLAFACVIRACISAWHARTVSVEYSESKYISVIIIGMLQTFPIGIPLIILSHSNPTGKYFVKSAIIFALTMSIQLLIFVPKIQFLRKDLARLRSGASRTNNRGSLITNGSAIVDNNAGSTTLGNSLRVVGMNQNLKRSTYETARPPPSRMGSFEATEVVSEITNRQVEDLRELLKETGKIDDATDLHSLVQKAGIVVSNQEQDRRTPGVGFASASSGGGVSVSTEGDIAHQDKK